jgi:hypothetical protein
MIKEKVEISWKKEHSIFCLKKVPIFTFLIIQEHSIFCSKKINTLIEETYSTNFLIKHVWMLVKKLFRFYTLKCPFFSFFIVQEHYSIFCLRKIWSVPKPFFIATYWFIIDTLLVHNGWDLSMILYWKLKYEFFIHILKVSLGIFYSLMMIQMQSCNCKVCLYDVNSDQNG